ncbi:hypothetical protein LTR74_014470 [Friedmanniomyces endolithicus]|nr:hypothetical protein LTR74_014470 [Friedmanniomyces endolithicus]
MVAIDLLPGIDISITVAGQALIEHQDSDEEEQDRTVTRYIEAVSGQVFAVRLTAQKGFKSRGDGLSFYIHVDGTENVDTAVYRKALCKLSGMAYTSQGRQEASEVKRYCFATLETTSEGPTSVGDAQRLKDLGTIVVTIRQVRVTGTCAEAIRPKGPFTVGVVSEKALKGQALSHSVNFAAPVPCVPRPVSFTTEPVRGFPDPYVKVVFRYRSLETLKCMSIIPRSPTPPPLEEREYDTVNREDFVELQRQLKALKKNGVPNVKVKRERTDENPRPRKVARPSRHSTQLELDEEGGVRESATPTVAEREIIDLD